MHHVMYRVDLGFCKELAFGSVEVPLLAFDALLIEISVCHSLKTIQVEVVYYV